MRINRLNEKIATLNEEMKRLEAIDKQRLAEPDQRISFTDPDARSMVTSGRGSGIVGYNVQECAEAGVTVTVPGRCASAARRSSTRLERSRRAWGRRTS